MWSMFSQMTGLPPTGPAYKLVSLVVSRFGVPCAQCSKGSGTDAQCSGCGGFKRYLSPAAIYRAHQVVLATFPSILAPEAADGPARLWSARKYQPASVPPYLGTDPIP